MSIENRTLTTGDRFVATYRKERFVALYDQLEPKKPFTLDEGPRLVGDRFSTLSDAGKKIMGGIACNGWRFFNRDDGSTPAPAPKTTRAKITRIPKPKTGIADGGLRQVVDKPAPVKAVKPTPTPIGKPRAARKPKAPSFPMHDACGLGHDPDIDCQTEQRTEQELDANA